MSKMTEQEKAFWYQKFTIEGRIFYPDLLEAKAKEEGKAPKFGCLFAWKMGTNPQATELLGKFLAQAKQTYFPTVPQQYFVNPCKRFDTYQRMDGKPNAEFLRDHYWMNLSSGKDYPPAVLHRNGQPVTALDKAEVYSGRNAVVSISFYKIDNDKKGVGVNINGVMLMEGGNKEGGSAAPNVSEMFGQFAADMNMGNAPAPQATPQYGHQGNTQANGHQYPSNNGPAAPQSASPSNTPAAPAWPPANGGGDVGGGFI